MRKYIILTILVFLFGKGISETLDSTFRIFTENNLQGLEDEEGKVVIPALYDQLGWSNGETEIINGVLGFKKDNSWGLISVKNEKITESIYTRLYPARNDLIIAGKKEKFYNRNIYGIINEKNRKIIPFQYYSIDPVGNHFIVSSLEGQEYRYGLIDNKGDVVLPIRFFSIRSESNYLLVENELNKLALYTDEGQSLTGFEYRGIYIIDERISFDLDGKFGISDLNGNFIIQPGKKDFVFPGSNTVDKVTRMLDFPTWHILTADNNQINTLEYDQIQPYENGYKVWANDYTSVLDEEFKKIEKDTVHFSIRYDSIFKSGDLYFGGNQSRDTYQWNVHDSSGKKISNQYYEDVGILSEDLISVKLDGFWGFIDQRGVLLIHGSYQEAEPYRNGLSLVTYYNQKGLIDYEGNWKILPSYASLDFVYDQTYIYQKGYSYGLVNGYEGVVYKTGNKLEEFNGMALETSQEGKYGLVDPNGNALFETDYDTIVFSPQTNHYILKQEDQFHLYNIENGKVYPLKENVQEVYQPTEGYFGIKANNKYGFVDLEGKLRISNRYDSILPVKNDLIPIKIRGKWGIINLSEQIVVQPLYSEVDPVSKDNIIVRNENGLGILDHYGKVVINATYERIQTLPNGHLKVTQNGKKGILDQKGNVLAVPRYEDILETDSDHYIIRREGRFGLITSKGISTIPPVYYQLIYDPFRDQYLGMIDSDWKVLK